MDPRLIRLLTLVRQEMELESTFLNSVPQWNISVITLLDGIAEIFEVPKEAIGEIVNGDVVA